MSGMVQLRKDAAARWPPRLPGELLIHLGLQVLLAVIGFGLWEWLSDAVHPDFRNDLRAAARQESWHP